MQQIRTTVATEFEQVNQLIVDQLHSDVPMVENVGHYIVDAGGKRLRPLLVLLTASTLGNCSQAHIKFAAIIELIHTATLLHDDVVKVVASDGHNAFNQREARLKYFSDGGHRSDILNNNTYIHWQPTAWYFFP